MRNYGLDQFGADLRTIIQAEGERGLPSVSEKLKQLLANPDFVASTFDETITAPKRVLLHDEETGVYVLAHVHPALAIPGVPHSHGTSWAVYGNAKGFTDMTVWKRLNPESDERAELTVADRYRLNEGEARFYSGGAIHSTAQPERAWTIRVTGTDLDALPRFRFKPGRDTIVEPSSVS